MNSADLEHLLERFFVQRLAPAPDGSEIDVQGEAGLSIQHREARLTALDTSVARGLADTGSGRTKSVAVTFDRLEAKYAGMLDRQA